MRFVFSLLYLLTLVFFLVLLARMVIDWVQFFARDWRPRGPMLVVAEAVYTVTDPPLRALRKVLPPVGFGQVRFDLAFLALALGCSILLGVFSTLAR